MPLPAHNEVSFSLDDDDYGPCHITISYQKFRLIGINVTAPPACHFYFENEGRPFEPHDDHSASMGKMTRHLLNKTLENKRAVTQGKRTKPLSPKHKDIVRNARDKFENNTL